MKNLISILEAILLASIIMTSCGGEKQNESKDSNEKYDSIVSQKKEVIALEKEDPAIIKNVDLFPDFRDLTPKLKKFV